MRGYGVRPDKITVVHRGRARGRLGEPSRERRAATRYQLGVPEGAPVLVNVGRHETQKDQKTFVEAVALVRKTLPNVRAFVLGREGTTTPLLLGKIKALGVEENVSLLGYRADVPDIVSASDVFVFPSLREGAAGSVLEAMALGRPIVASDIPALRDILGGGAGALVPPCDASAFARAIVDLLSNTERASLLSRTALRCFEDTHSLDHVADRMVALFRSVASGQGGLVPSS
nr:glycosyltransferase family 4 protein [Rubricoccus marinus]